MRNPYTFTAGWDAPGGEASLRISNAVDGDRQHRRISSGKVYDTSQFTYNGLMQLVVLQDDEYESETVDPPAAYDETNDKAGFRGGPRGGGGLQSYTFTDFTLRPGYGQSRLYTVTNIPRARDHEGPENWGTHATQIKPGEPNFGNFAVVDTDAALNPPKTSAPLSLGAAPEVTIVGAFFGGMLDGASVWADTLTFGWIGHERSQAAQQRAIDNGDIISQIGFGGGKVSARALQTAGVLIAGSAAAGTALVQEIGVATMSIPYAAEAITVGGTVMAGGFGAKSLYDSYSDIQEGDYANAIANVFDAGLAGHFATKGTKTLLSQKGRSTTSTMSAKAEEKVSVYHKGDLSKGLNPRKPLSTGTERQAVNAIRESGKIYEFQIPKSVLQKWLGDESARKFRDLDAITGVINEEIRIYQKRFEELMKYLVQK